MGQALHCVASASSLLIEFSTGHSYHCAQSCVLPLPLLAVVALAQVALQTTTYLDENRLKKHQIKRQ